MIACKTWQSFVFGVVARRFDVAEVRCGVYLQLR